jgi:hypothetical protein
MQRITSLLLDQLVTATVEMSNSEPTVVVGASLTVVAIVVEVVAAIVVIVVIVAAVAADELMPNYRN